MNQLGKFWDAMGVVGSSEVNINTGYLLFATILSLLRQKILHRLVLSGLAGRFYLRIELKVLTPGIYGYRHRLVGSSFAECILVILRHILMPVNCHLWRRIQLQNSQIIKY